MNLELLRIRERERAENLLRELRPQVQEAFFDLGIQYWQENNALECYLIWLQWSRIYRVPFSQVVKLVVGTMRAMLHKSGTRLGLSLKSLCAGRILDLVGFEKHGHRETSFTFVKPQEHDIEQYVEDLRRYRINARKRRESARPYRGSGYWAAQRVLEPDAIEALND